MSVEVEKLEHNMATITMTADAGQLEDAIEKAYRKERNKISIPGFRKGKVPRKMIEKMYGENVFYDEAANILIPEIYAKMLEDEKDLNIVSSPEIDVTQIEQGKPFVFTAKVALKPPVTLGQYKGVEVAKQERKLTDEEFNEALEQERSRHARMVEVTDRPVQDGDSIKLDFEGTIDGKPFEGGKSENYPLTIGSGSFIPGFEDQLIGAAIDEEKEVHVTFPEDYHAEDLKGRNAVFTCKVRSISKRELPELNDEYASDISDFETLEEYKEDLRKTRQKEKEDTARRQIEDEAVAAAVENAEMDVPDAMIDSQVDSMLEDFSRQLSSQGITMQQYLKFTGATMDSLREQTRPDALRRIKTRLVLEAVADAENITTSDERLDEEIGKMAEMYQMEVDKMKKLIDDSQKDTMRRDIAVQDAATLIADAAVEVERKAEEDTGAEDAAEDEQDA